jgi:hypothetical protein
VVGNYVQFTGAVSLGGNVTAAILNINQGFEIATVINANAYTIVVPVTANASDSGNGGSATIGKYQIPVGTQLVHLVMVGVQILGVVVSGDLVVQPQYF